VLPSRLTANVVAPRPSFLKRDTNSTRFSTTAPAAFGTGLEKRITKSSVRNAGDEPKSKRPNAASRKDNGSKSADWQGSRCGWPYGLSHSLWMNEGKAVRNLRRLGAALAPILSRRELGGTMNKTFRRQLAIATALQLADPRFKHVSAGQSKDAPRRSAPKEKRSSIAPLERHRTMPAPVRYSGINE